MTLKAISWQVNTSHIAQSVMEKTSNLKNILHRNK